ncbi:ribosomal protein S18 acetylase RimI-like enzyme [Micromonospora violae]|uniref:Ribosomal protein S18 acetylase RimI-like enzyme n=1 Tax=Micromonospora violae TaxID=1278207 RepID=A0A4Q7UES5_9ACTN|nr:GNAT family N-acetyltransferase [Micromonospora violae]RZT79636.1 ribosomal protein S18 acetylase RimI-like enzyme [Micromonospora violae]
MGGEKITVRPAVLADVGSLVRMRESNAEAHLVLDPQVYRIPETEAVVRHFSAVLTEDTTRHAVLVAEVAGRLVGMVEVVRNPDPPDHQILRPEPSAQIHTVVTDEARNQGIGSMLLEAAEDWAAAQGIGYLSAGIHHRNAGAVRFYGRHGYADSGRLLGRRVTA